MLIKNVYSSDLKTHEIPFLYLAMQRSIKGCASIRLCAELQIQHLKIISGGRSKITITNADLLTPSDILDYIVNDRLDIEILPIFHRFVLATMRLCHDSFIMKLQGRLNWSASSWLTSTMKRAVGASLMSSMYSTEPIIMRVWTLSEAISSYRLLCHTSKC